MMAAMDGRRAVGTLLVLIAALSFGSASVLARPVYDTCMGWLGLVTWRFLIGAGLAWAWVAASPSRRSAVGRLSRRQVLVAEFPADKARDELVRGPQTGCRHIGLEDREERRHVGQQEALAPIEPQQVRVPVLRVTRRCRVGDRRADDGQELPRTP